MKLSHRRKFLHLVAGAGTSFSRIARAQGYPSAGASDRAIAVQSMA
jgi:hypothetical protein